MPKAPRRRPTPAISVTLGGDPNWKILWRRVRGCWGITCFGTKEIRLDPSCKPARKEREIALHEGIHAIAPYLDEEIVKNMAIELDAMLEALEL
jgi:hypothetical protein